MDGAAVATTIITGVFAISLASVKQTVWLVRRTQIPRDSKAFRALKYSPTFDDFLIPQHRPQLIRRSTEQRNPVHVKLNN